MIKVKTIKNVIISGGKGEVLVSRFLRGAVTMKSILKAKVITALISALVIGFSFPSSDVLARDSGGGKVAEFDWGDFAINTGIQIGTAVIAGGLSGGIDSAAAGSAGYASDFGSGFMGGLGSGLGNWAGSYGGGHAATQASNMIGRIGQNQEWDPRMTNFASTALSSMVDGGLSGDNLAIAGTKGVIAGGVIAAGTNDDGTVDSWAPAVGNFAGNIGGNFLAGGFTAATQQPSNTLAVKTGADGDYTSGMVASQPDYTFSFGNGFDFGNAFSAAGQTAFSKSNILGTAVDLGFDYLAADYEYGSPAHSLVSGAGSLVSTVARKGANYGNAVNYYENKIKTDAILQHGAVLTAQDFDYLAADGVFKGKEKGNRSGYTSAISDATGFNAQASGELLKGMIDGRARSYSEGTPIDTYMVYNPQIVKQKTINEGVYLTTKDYSGGYGNISTDTYQTVYDNASSRNYNAVKSPSYNVDTQIPSVPRRY